MPAKTGMAKDEHMPDHATSTDPAVQAQLDRLTMLSPGKDVLGLERIATLLERLGNPHHHLPPVFHVSGTNGKDLDKALPYMFTKVMVANIDVLGSGTKLG